MVVSVGIKVVYRGRSPEGNNVESVLVRCAACDVPEYLPLNETEHYAIILTSYLMNGGDRYTMLGEEAISWEELGIPFLI